MYMLLSCCWISMFQPKPRSRPAGQWYQIQVLRTHTESNIITHIVVSLSIFLFFDSDSNVAPPNASNASAFALSSLESLFISTPFSSPSLSRFLLNGTVFFIPSPNAISLKIDSVSCLAACNLWYVYLAHLCFMHRPGEGRVPKHVECIHQNQFQSSVKLFWRCLPSDPPR